MNKGFGKNVSDFASQFWPLHALATLGNMKQIEVVILLVSLHPS